MKSIDVNWNEEEFKAYLLIYVMTADYTEKKIEKDFIIKLVGPDVFKKMHREFDDDNDFQSIQKILFCINKFGYTETEINRLESEMHALMVIDGEKDELERNFYLGLHKLLHTN